MKIQIGMDMMENWRVPQKLQKNYQEWGDCSCTCFACWSPRINCYHQLVIVS